MVMFARHDERRALRVWRSLASSMRQADDNADRDHAEATAAVLDAFVRRRRAFLAWRTYIARQRAAIGTIIRSACSRLVIYDGFLTWGAFLGSRRANPSRLGECGVR